MRVTISGHSGCGTTTACGNVAKELGLQVLNYTLRNMAAEMGVTLEELQLMAEKDPKYDYLVDKKQIDMADGDNFVIGTRLAGWAVDNADLRVWLHASLETRAKRIASREGKPYGQVLEAVKLRDAQNKDRYMKYYGLDMDDKDGFDLIINTEYLTAAQVSAIIVAAANLAKENRIPKPIKIARHIREVIENNLKVN